MDLTHTYVFRPLYNDYALDYQPKGVRTQYFRFFLNKSFQDGSEKDFIYMAIFSFLFTFLSSILILFTTSKYNSMKREQNRRRGSISSVQSSESIFKFQYLMKKYQARAKAEKSLFVISVVDFVSMFLNFTNFFVSKISLKRIHILFQLLLGLWKFVIPSQALQDFLDNFFPVSSCVFCLSQFLWLMKLLSWHFRFTLLHVVTAWTSEYAAQEIYADM